MAGPFSIIFSNDFGSDVRLQISAGPNDPHNDGCNTNLVRYDDVLKNNDQHTFDTSESNVCWRRSSGPGSPNDLLPAGWNIVEYGVDPTVTIKMSNQV
jgi:hypothetical protein